MNATKVNPMLVKKMVDKNKENRMVFNKKRLEILVTTNKALEDYEKNK